MANTITQRDQFVGPYRVYRFVHIVSDGSEETDLIVFDRSTYDSVTNQGRVMSIRACGSTCVCRLEWDQSTDSPISSFDPAYSQYMCYEKLGGICNPGGTGATGDILLTTANLDSGDEVTLIIEVRLV